VRSYIQQRCTELVGAVGIDQKITDYSREVEQATQLSSALDL
jgi:hypothetical protein